MLPKRHYKGKEPAYKGSFRVSKSLSFHISDTERDHSGVKGEDPQKESYYE
jgi:hypothetical protein